MEGITFGPVRVLPLVHRCVCCPRVVSHTRLLCLACRKRLSAEALAKEKENEAHDR